MTVGIFFTCSIERSITDGVVDWCAFSRIQVRGVRADSNRDDITFTTCDQVSDNKYIVSIDYPIVGKVSIVTYTTVTVEVEVIVKAAG